MSSDGKMDVAVLGGGPAGISAAITLVRAGRSVALFERSSYDQPRAGETLGPEVRPLLEQIGAWDAFQLLPSVPFRATISAWGSEEPVERSSIFHPMGEGWHVDRAQLDAELARTSASRGVDVRLGCGYCAVDRTDSGWSISPRNGDAVSARFLIDASGRGAPATSYAIRRRRWGKFDRLIAISARVRVTGDRTLSGELLLESSGRGWWYTVPQPIQSAVVTYLTDADLMPAGGRPAWERAWRTAFHETVHTRLSVGDPPKLVRIVRAESGVLMPDHGDGWIAAGDAAMAWDPLSGSGFARALRSGIEVAGIADRALRGEAVMSRTEERVPGYLQRRTQYYAMERRWRDRPFWARRIPGKPQSGKSA